MSGEVSALAARLQPVALGLGAFLVLLLLAIWNLPHTIALKHSAGGLLLLLVLARPAGLAELPRQALPLLLFMAWLLVYFTLIIPESEEAFRTFKSEWLKFVLFALIGWGVGVMLRDRDPVMPLLAMGVAACTPLFIHLVLFVRESLRMESIPWGYWGINEIHGDLGYAALMATLLLGTLLLFQPLGRWPRAVVLFCLAACLISPILAKSRGGFAFVLLTLLLLVGIRLVMGQGFRDGLRRVLLMGMAVVAVLLAAVPTLMTSDAERWSAMLERLRLGTTGDPELTICQGLPHVREVLKAQGVELTEALEKDLYTLTDGDGMRSFLFLMGVRLVQEYPLGVDGSRDAYQHAIERKCTPAIHASHVHNGWLDTALAIGIPGALLYLMVLVALARQGWQRSKDSRVSRVLAVALFMTAVMWILRSMVDSAQRDQMLEMQIFLLMLLSAASTPPLLPQRPGAATP